MVDKYRGQTPPDRTAKTPAKPPTPAVPAPPRAQNKPYGFIPLPESFTTNDIVWQDGSISAGRISGEIRLELETLTPMLVGWDRKKLGETDLHQDNKFKKVNQNKPVLCPLRSPWGKRPVLIPGDSLKGLLRHELGALLGAPMERVAKRSYSYRPNMVPPEGAAADQRFEPRMAKVVETIDIEVGREIFRAPTMVAVFAPATREQQTYELPFEGEMFAYRGGMGAGTVIDGITKSPKGLHHRVALKDVKLEYPTVKIHRNDEVIQQYHRTLEHLLASDHGHFSARHPSLAGDTTKQNAALDTVKDAAKRAFTKDDLIWIEWDKDKKRVVSFGWHYYYRWAYVGTVHERAKGDPRPGLGPVKEELKQPLARLSPVRRLLGYVGDNDGSKGIGDGNISQMMGRISINAAQEVVKETDRDDERFLPPTFLKELGRPRPSAVEHYLKQPYWPHRPRPSDPAQLVTYGDLQGVDSVGDIAGRKFYLDRNDAHGGEPWKDDSEENRANERSTVATGAARKGRKFRFTLRFWDLDPEECAAILTALCPHQFRYQKGKREGDYCSKLGYARPLGWGSVRIEAKELYVLKDGEDGTPKLIPHDVPRWFSHTVVSLTKPAWDNLWDTWMEIHRCKHPQAADYPKVDNQVFSYHTLLRANHAKNRRLKPKQSR